MAAGYPTVLFLDLIDRSHSCGLCRQVLRGPVSTKCGHVFCFGCLRNWLDRYGLCPLGCKAVDVSELSAATDIEEEISRLFVKCTNWKAGCTKIMKLAELSEHEFDCEFSVDVNRKKVMVGWPASPELPSRSNSFNIKPSPSTKSLADRLADSPTKGATKTSVTVRINKTEGESMGFHIVGGEKACDNIIISGVLIGYPAHKAGLLDNDKLLKVDGVDVSTLMHHEVVDLMLKSRSNPLLISVERTCHYYEEIGPYSQDKIQPENRITRRRSHTRERKHSSFSPRNSRVQPLSASTTALSRHSFASTSFKKEISPIQTSASSSNIKKNANVSVARTPSLPIKKRIVPTVKNALGLGSPTRKSMELLSTPTCHTRQSSSPANMRQSSPISNGPDSGLSSGDKSPSQENQPGALQRNSQYRTSLRTQKEMKQIQQRQRRASSPMKANKAKAKHSDIKNMGEYELEDITLNKNLSSRLGVTLGYDENSEDSNIYVVEILPDGIAAQDARLQVGDIITKVNGFEVYDTEEAILYFLEQDPEIVLSVARPIHKKPNLAQESSALSGLRRYDSCGSLDSRTVNHITKTDSKSNSSGYNSQEYDSMQRGDKTDEKESSGRFYSYFMNQITETSSNNHELNESRVHLHTARYSCNETQV